MTTLLSLALRLSSVAAWAELLQTLTKEAEATRTGLDAVIERQAWESARGAAKGRLVNEEPSKKSLANEPYFVLAFFAHGKRPKEWLNFIGSIAGVCEPKCRQEWSVFMKMPVWDFTRGTTSHLRVAKTLRATVLRIADVCPSEASVERAFSTMGRVFGHHCGKLSDARVEMQVQVVSFTEPPAIPQRSKEISPSPQPPRRSEPASPVENRNVAPRAEQHHATAAADRGAFALA